MRENSYKYDFVQGTHVNNITQNYHKNFLILQKRNRKLNSLYDDHYMSLKGYVFLFKTYNYFIFRRV